MDKYIEENINRIWLISDTHFFHKKIVEYAGRPENNQILMLNNWNANIQEDDIVFHLGDFALGDCLEIENLILKLNGLVYLISGNHDKYFKRKEVYEKYFIILKYIRYKDIIFTHKPLKKFPDEKYNINFNIHGHIHEKIIQDNRWINVCVEQTNYSPIKLIDLLERVNNDKNITSTS